MAEAGPNVGFATLQIIPSLKGVEAAVAGQLKPVETAAAASGAKAGAGLTGGFAAALKKFAAPAAIAGLGIAAVASAIKVEDATKLIARATGATGEQLESLEESFKNVARATPASFETVATALSEVSQRTGLSGKALEDFTRQVITFNRITRDAPVNVQDLTKALAGFGVPAEKISSTFDTLFKASQRTGVPIAQLIQTLNKSGPIIRQFGLPIGEATSFLAQLDKAGVEASPIIAGLRAAFVKFAKAGLEPADALKKTLTSIQDLIAAGDIAGARKIGVQLFGARGSGLVDAAIQGKLSLDNLKDSFSGAGAGILETAKATSTISGKLGVLKNQATLAFAELGKPVIDILNDALKAAMPLLTQLTALLTEIAEHPNVSKVILAVGAALVTLLIANKVAIAIQSLTAAETGLNLAFLANPIVLVAAALALFAVEVVFLSKKLNNFALIVVAAFIPFLGLPALIIKNWSKITSFFSGLVESITGFFKNLSADDILEFFKSIPGRIVSALAALPGVLVALGARLITALRQGIEDNWVTVVAFFVSLPGRILSAIVGFDTFLLSVGEAIIGGLYKGLVLGFFAVLQFFIDLPLNVVKAVGAIQDALFGAGIALIEGFVRGIVIAWNAGVAFFKNLPNTILILLASLGQLLVNTGISLIQSLFRGISAAWEVGKAFFINLPSTIANLISGAANALVQVGKDLVSGIVKGIKSAPGAIIDAIKDLIPGGGILGEAADKLHLPHFAGGGIVPGPIGAPVLAVVHGGEQVLTQQDRSSSGGGNIQVNLVGSTVTAEDITREVRWLQLTGS